MTLEHKCEDPLHALLQDNGVKLAWEACVLYDQVNHRKPGEVVSPLTPEPENPFSFLPLSPIGASGKTRRDSLMGLASYFRSLVDQMLTKITIPLMEGFEPYVHHPASSHPLGDLSVSRMSVPLLFQWLTDLVGRETPFDNMFQMITLVQGICYSAKIKGWASIWTEKEWTQFEDAATAIQVDPLRGATATDIKKKASHSDLQKVQTLKKVALEISVLGLDLAREYLERTLWTLGHLSDNRLANPHHDILVSVFQGMHLEDFRALSDSSLIELLTTAHSRYPRSIGLFSSNEPGDLETCGFFFTSFQNNISRFAYPTSHIKSTETIDLNSLLIAAYLSLAPSRLSNPPRSAHITRYLIRGLMGVWTWSDSFVHISQPWQELDSIPLYRLVPPHIAACVPRVLDHPEWCLWDNLRVMIQELRVALIYEHYHFTKDPSALSFVFDVPAGIKSTTPPSSDVSSDLPQTLRVVVYPFINPLELNEVYLADLVEKVGVGNTDFFRSIARSLAENERSWGDRLWAGNMSSHCRPWSNVSNLDFKTPQNVSSKSKDVILKICGSHRQRAIDYKDPIPGLSLPSSPLVEENLEAKFIYVQTLKGFTSSCTWWFTEAARFLFCLEDSQDPVNSLDQTTTDDPSSTPYRLPRGYGNEEGEWLTREQFNQSSPFSALLMDETWFPPFVNHYEAQLWKSFHFYVVQLIMACCQSIPFTVLCDQFSPFLIKLIPDCLDVTTGRISEDSKARTEFRKNATFLFHQHWVFRLCNLPFVSLVTREAMHTPEFFSWWWNKIHLETVHSAKLEGREIDGSSDLDSCDWMVQDDLLMTLLMKRVGFLLVEWGAARVPNPYLIVNPIFHSKVSEFMDITSTKSQTFASPLILSLDLPLPYLSSSIPPRLGPLQSDPTSTANRVSKTLARGFACPMAMSPQEARFRFTWPANETALSRFRDASKNDSHYGPRFSSHPWVRMDQEVRGLLVEVEAFVKMKSLSSEITRKNAIWTRPAFWQPPLHGVLETLPALVASQSSKDLWESRVTEKIFVKSWKLFCGIEWKEYHPAKTPFVGGGGGSLIRYILSVLIDSWNFDRFLYYCQRSYKMLTVDQDSFLIDRPTLNQNFRFLFRPPGDQGENFLYQCYPPEKFQSPKNDRVFSVESPAFDLLCAFNLSSFNGPPLIAEFEYSYDTSDNLYKRMQSQGFKTQKDQLLEIFPVQMNVESSKSSLYHDSWVSVLRTPRVSPFEPVVKPPVSQPPEEKEELDRSIREAKSSSVGLMGDQMWTTGLEIWADRVEFVRRYFPDLIQGIEERWADQSMENRWGSMLKRLSVADWDGEIDENGWVLGAESSEIGRAHV